MVDFNKRLGNKPTEKPIEPRAIYDRLDRASDKGPLREAQAFILDQWHTQFRGRKDVIVKLHTGQGKTLIGLLMLQSRLNEGTGPVIYLCPNHHLVDQTCEQAKAFGISAIRVKDEIPAEFFESRAIIVAVVHKLFNGRTQFKLSPRSVHAGTILMDDCHACVDAIRDSVSIRVDRQHAIFDPLLGLFEADLRQQGAGTFEEIKGKQREALLSVPYWTWLDRSDEVTSLLARYAESDELKFVWPILKDRLHDCTCFISGTSIEVVPHLAPLDVFGTFWNAPHRIFMSATVTDDSFLIKGLRLDKDAILNPLTYAKEKWSGEKMILVPSLIDEKLDRSEIVNAFGPPNSKRRYGVVVLAPSESRTRDWAAAGARVATRANIDEIVGQLRLGNREHTVVLVNRYDGIDLPDECCRLLIFDSLPQGDSLADRYIEIIRPGSDLQNIRLARSVEQGLGRSVRGEKDYSVIFIVGPELVRFLRQQSTRSFLSEQTRKQVEIGLNVSAWAQQEDKGATSLVTLSKVADQCLKREEGWKEFYFQEMNTLTSAPMKAKGLEQFEMEARAEALYQNHNPAGAAALLQNAVDTSNISEYEKGFYLQEMARYLYRAQRVESKRLQIAAHTRNRSLLRPTEGSQVQQLRPLPGLRIENIIKWVRSHGMYDQLKVAVDDICSRLQFGAASEEFERAVQEMGRALGFSSERPDREWKAGPDNLWCLAEGDYLLIECKNEVDLARSEINRAETGQMNNAVAWFRENYPGARCTRLMIIPTNKPASGAAFAEEVGIVRKAELDRLRKNFREFFVEFRSDDFGSLSEKAINERLIAHKLTIENIQADYQKGTYAGRLR